MILRMTGGWKRKAGSETGILVRSFILQPLSFQICGRRKAPRFKLKAVRPKDIQNIGSELAIKWEDGSESFIPLEGLRRHCPCASCKGEEDIMGNVSMGPKRNLTEASFQLRRIGWIGGYGIQPYWADGHSSGIFSFDHLKRMADAP